MGFGPIFVLFVGLATLALGIAFRVGKLSRDKPWYRRYRDQSLPLIYRNSTLAVLPGSIGVILIGLALPALHLSRPLGIGVLIAGLFIVFGSFTVALFSPGWLKPAWLRADDEKWGCARLQFAFPRKKERIGNS